MLCDLIFKQMTTYDAFWVCLDIFLFTFLRIIALLVEILLIVVLSQHIVITDCYHVECNFYCSNSNCNSTFIALNLCQKTGSKANHTKTLLNIHRHCRGQHHRERRKRLEIKGGYAFSKRFNFSFDLKEASEFAEWTSSGRSFQIIGVSSAKLSPKCF